ncbi:hypothetical protein D3C77_403890 [compost metagenome]
MLLMIRISPNVQSFSRLWILCRQVIISLYHREVRSMRILHHHLIAAKAFRIVDNQVRIYWCAILNLVRNALDTETVQHAAFLGIGVIKPAHGGFDMFGFSGNRGRTCSCISIVKLAKFRLGSLHPRRIRRCHITGVWIGFLGSRIVFLNIELPSERCPTDGGAHFLINSYCIDGSKILVD